MKTQAEVNTNKKLFKRINISNSTYFKMKVLEGKYRAKKVSLIDVLVNNELCDHLNEDSKINTGINISPETLETLNQMMVDQNKTFNKIVTELVDQHYEKMMKDNT